MSRFAIRKSRGGERSRYSTCVSLCVLWPTRPPWVEGHAEGMVFDLSWDVMEHGAGLDARDLPVVS